MHIPHGSKWPHSICVFAESLPQPEEEVLARPVNMRKIGVCAQPQTMSPGLNCGPDAQFNKQTDKTKGRGPEKGDFIDEIMKLN